MKNGKARALRLILIAATGAALLALALWPETLRVDSAPVELGRVRETLEAEGRTRVRERHVIAAPMAAQARRLTLEPGDPVKAGEALLTLEPLATPALDARSRAQAEAQIEAASAQRLAAAAEARAADSAAALARAELLRQQGLAAQGMVSPAALQQAETAAQRAELAAQGARFREATAGHQWQAAQAALTAAGPGGRAALVLTAPLDGVVLRRHYQSARSVQAGEPLLEIGDPRALEVEVDVLSADAVRLRPGQAVELTRWGGEPALEGRVQRIEPGAFAKVSALGVEEQRVWVIVELLSPRERWQRLGEGYRVLARFVLAQQDDALQVPTSAVFRQPDGSAALFRIEGGRARLQPVELGLQGEGRSAIRRGLSQGDRVVLHPPRELEDGARVEQH